MLKVKLAKSPAAWQISQAAVPMGTWFEGGALVAGAPMKFAATPAAWQPAQAIPGTAACTMAGGAVPDALANWKLVKVLAEWQLSQAAVPNGTWLAGGAFSGFVVHAPAKLNPAAWHCAHWLVMPA